MRGRLEAGADIAIAALPSASARALTTLAHLVGIPGVSARTYPPDEVRRSAEAVAETLLEYGLESVRLLETALHPAVYGELRIAPDAPTVLVYGHHDVQPPGRADRWASPPFEAIIRDGRMFGRGTADDKGGFLAYLGAVRASASADALPCNLKFLIEGEEEIGSPHLAALLEENGPLLASDFVVLCDTPNFATGVPALTYRLRGNCIVDVEVRCLERPVHSGQGGGLLPDATAILCAMLARLHDENGTVIVPGLAEEVRTEPAQLEAARSVPFDSRRLRRDFGLLDGVALLARSWESVWNSPSLTITAIESVPIAEAANQIASSARARLSLRTVPDLDTGVAGQMLARALEANVPHGARVTTTIVGGPSWWEADPRHPLLAAGQRALSRGFGVEAVMMGSGGSIGFVKPFADLSSRPLLLTGVQDPGSNAHSENESLHLGDFGKAMASAIYLFHELADLHQGAAA